MDPNRIPPSSQNLPLVICKIELKNSNKKNVNTILTLNLTLRQLCVLDVGSLFYCFACTQRNTHKFYTHYFKLTYTHFMDYVLHFV